jgi:hypothetical protein
MIFDVLSGIGRKYTKASADKTHRNGVILHRKALSKKYRKNPPRLTLC